MTLTRTNVVNADISNAGGADRDQALANALNGLLNNAVDASGIASKLSTITLGAPASGQQTATIQLKDQLGNNLAAATPILAYMCTDSAGATPSGSGAATSAAVTTGGTIATLVSKLAWLLVTNASGQAVLTFNNTGGGGAYTNRVVLITPFGPVVSAALAVPTS